MAELYTICRMGWNSFIANLAEFSAFLNTYTAVYGQDALNEIDAAEAMPEFQERNEQAELALVQVRQTAKLALKNWKFLRNYIRTSFPEADRKAKWESAGSDHYNKASNQNWSELRNMLTAGSNFLTANAAIFAASGVPATFAGAYGLSRTAFNDALVAFTNFEQDEVEGTDLKVIANNAIYNKLMDMFEDGTLLFEDIPAKHERFVFAHLKEIITNSATPSNSTSTDITFDGTVTNGAAAQSLPTVAVIARLEESTEELTVLTDATGKYRLIFTDIAAGYTGNVIIKVMLPAYELYEAIVPVEAGSNYVQDILLIPAAPAPPAPLP